MRIALFDGADFAYLLTGCPLILTSVELNNLPPLKLK